MRLQIALGARRQHPFCDAEEYVHSLWRGDVLLYYMYQMSSMFQGIRATLSRDVTMAVYHGIVKDNRVIFTGDAQLADGLAIEVLSWLLHPSVACRSVQAPGR